MDSFVYNTQPGRVIFGAGSLQKLPEEVRRLGLLRPLILSTPQQIDHAKAVASILNGHIVGIFSEATMHTPVEVTNAALKYGREKNADSVISIGGGSTIGLGKAITSRTGLPHICIPTTYAGSEMTPILGETENGRKTTRTDSSILPGTVIYDVDLTLTLPKELSATSGINAIAHAVEALYARDTNPIISLLAVEGIKALVEALPVIVDNPSSVPARSRAQYGAWLCGLCLGSVGMALHHKLCHTLGGTFNLPHAETHAIVLPHALAYNAPNVPRAMEALGNVFPEDDPIQGFNEFLRKMPVKRGLKDYGMPDSGIDEAANIATQNPYWNPRELQKEELRELIRRAWAGEDARIGV